MTRRAPNSGPRAGPGLVELPRGWGTWQRETCRMNSGMHGRRSPELATKPTKAHAACPIHAPNVPGATFVAMRGKLARSAAEPVSIGLCAP